jgi:hypothetical protein
MAWDQVAYDRAMRKAKAAGRDIPEERDFFGFNKTTRGRCPSPNGSVTLLEDDAGHWWLQHMDRDGNLVVEIDAGSPSLLFAKARGQGVEFNSDKLLEGVDDSEL